MPVDVVTSIEIERPVAEVAGFASDPDNVPTWYKNIRSVEWRTDPPLGLGSRVAFVAQFLHRRLVYTYEVTVFEAHRRLVMAADDGPFPMETSYAWEDLGGGRTRMTLRNRGGPPGILFMNAFLSAMMKRANRKDLATLKQILEAGRD